MKWRTQPPARKVSGSPGGGSGRNEMSRTDRTKPLWVRYAEHHPRPVHDHRHGACDLPPNPTREDGDTRCRWEHPGTLLFGSTCCSGCKVRSCIKERQQMVRADNRKDRYAGRREARLSVTGEDSD
ncbi:hypothetical protein OG754_37890 [Streptomyces decoyicus]|uniref:hypothetical protein n=1 Tax=Streptomyces decoyicus TaxID=249567 RepID=UPI002E33AEDD|nr:hypothetical protein [Streptomyces decoyicus]